jgi:hypothetical protein
MPYNRVIECNVCLLGKVTQACVELYNKEPIDLSSAHTPALLATPGEGPFIAHQWLTIAAQVAPFKSS